MNGTDSTLRGGRSGSRVATLLAVSCLALVPAGAATAANPTTLSISCTPKGLAPGEQASCAATVTDSGPVASRVPPSGIVSFSTAGEGSFDPADAACLLEPSGAFSSRCGVVYTPTAISGGSHRLLGSYGGDDGHGRATSAFAITVAPANDELDDATRLPVPAKLTGTTEGATFNYDDDPDLCSDAYAPVWYSVKPSRAERVAVRLTVKGRVDAVVAVFRQDRAKLADLGCQLTDASGVAGVPVDMAAGTTYLIAVAAPWDARSGGFTIEAAIVPPVRFPGIRLARDATVSLDPLLHPDAVFSVRLRQAVAYRISASGRGACVHVTLLRQPQPGAGPLAASDGCSGYLVYTPGSGTSGVFPLLVSLPAGRHATVQVAVRAAEADDLAPGRLLVDGTVRHGSLSARDADVVDVYRFDVPRLADAALTFGGGVPADLLLLDSRGKRLGCACDGLDRSSLVERLSPGSYYAIVRGRPAASGSYALTVRLRQPTTTTVRLLPLEGTHPQVAVAAGVRPGGVAGRFVVELERFDPLSKWQFVAAGSHRVVAGRTAFTLRPSLGAWRVRTRYGGTLTASPSFSDWITFTVDETDGGHGNTSAAPTSGCAPMSAARFTVGGVTVSCISGSLGARPAAPATPAKSPSAQLRDLKSAVDAIAMLKDPFESRLLAELDAAIAALSNDKPADADASLDDFVTTLQSTPKAQLTADEQNRLAASAKRIQAQLGTN